MMHIEKFLISFVPILNTKNGKKKSIQFCPRDFQLSAPNLHLLAYLVRKPFLPCLSHLENSPRWTFMKNGWDATAAKYARQFRHWHTQHNSHSYTWAFCNSTFWAPPSFSFGTIFVFPPTRSSSFPILFLSLCLFFLVCLQGWGCEYLRLLYCN